MKFGLTARALWSVATLSFVSSTFAQTDGSADVDTGRAPNILLVIADDVGTDVTSDMYPGLIDGLVERY
jgi:hypothetical protein